MESENNSFRSERQCFALWKSFWDQLGEHVSEAFKAYLFLEKCAILFLHKGLSAGEMYFHTDYRRGQYGARLCAAFTPSVNNMPQFLSTMLFTRIILQKFV